MRREIDVMFAALPQRFERLEGDVRALDERVGRFEAGLAENTAVTKRVDESTSTIVAFVNDVGAVWKVCKWFRRVVFLFAKWIAAVSAAVTGVIGAAHAIGAIDVRTWFR